MQRIINGKENIAEGKDPKKTFEWQKGRTN